MMDRKGSPVGRGFTDAVNLDPKSQRGEIRLRPGMRFGDDTGLGAVWNIIPSPGGPFYGAPLSLGPPFGPTAEAFNAGATPWVDVDYNPDTDTFLVADGRFGSATDIYRGRSDATSWGYATDAGSTTSGNSDRIAYLPSYGRWLLLSSNSTGVRHSDDDGDTWTTVSGIPASNSLRVIGGQPHSCVTGDLGVTKRIISSSDGGLTWSDVAGSSIGTSLNYADVSGGLYALYTGNRTTSIIRQITGGTGTILPDYVNEDTPDPNDDFTLSVAVTPAWFVGEDAMFLANAPGRLVIPTDLTRASTYQQITLISDVTTQWGKPCRAGGMRRPYVFPYTRFTAGFPSAAGVVFTTDFESYTNYPIDGMSLATASAAGANGTVVVVGATYSGFSVTAGRIAVLRF